MWQKWIKYLCVKVMKLNIHVSKYVSFGYILTISRYYYICDWWAKTFWRECMCSFDHPWAFGLNVVVRMWYLIQSFCHLAAKFCTSIWISGNGGPNRAIQVDINALHTDIDVMPVIGTASNHLIHKSINVSKYLGLLVLSAGSKRPTTSIWTFVNRCLGTAKSFSGRLICFPTFEDWHAKNSLHQAWASFLISRQKYLV